MVERRWRLRRGSDSRGDGKVCCRCLLLPLPLPNPRNPRALLLLLLLLLFPLRAERPSLASIAADETRHEI